MAIIDPFIIPIGGTYYLLYKRELRAPTTAATWASASGGQATFTVGTALSSVVYVGGHVELGGRGTVFAPSGWNGIFQIVATDNTAGTITVTMPSNPGSTTTLGDLSIEFIELASAPAITGPYTNLQYGNWAGWGRGEAQKVAVLGANKFAVYFDNDPGSSVAQFSCCVSVSSTGLTGSGTTPTSAAPAAGTWSVPPTLTGLSGGRTAGKINATPRITAFNVGGVKEIGS